MKVHFEGFDWDLEKVVFFFLQLEEVKMNGVKKKKKNALRTKFTHYGQFTVSK